MILPPASGEHPSLCRITHSDLALAFCKAGGLGGNNCHEFLPGFHERLRAFLLELGSQGINIDAGAGEPRQHLFAVSPVRSEERRNVTAIRKRFESALGHGVDREWCGQNLDVHHVGRRRILGARAGPQETLRPGAGVVDALPAR